MGLVLPVLTHRIREINYSELLYADWEVFKKELADKKIYLSLIHI